MNREKRGNNQFQTPWLSTYKWIKKKSSTHVTCTICMKDVAFDNMGEAALKSHAKPNPPGKAPTKHQRLMAEKEKTLKSLAVLHYMSPTQSSTSFPSPQSSQSTSRSSEDQCSESPTFSQQNSVQPTMDTYIMPLSVAHAEIRWVMEVEPAISHYDHVWTLKIFFQACFQIVRLQVNFL